MASAFDRECSLDELLDPSQLAGLARDLGMLLGSPCALADARGKLLVGSLEAGMRSQAVALELEPLLVLHAATEPAALQAAGRLAHALLRAQARFRMASALHLEAVAEDYETLKREHARLVESEARYRQLADELEARVQAQVTQLEERQQMLYEAEKLASVGRLAAGMAHEINNPLGFVRSNLGSFRQYLERFGQLGERLAEGKAAWQALDLDFLLEDGRELLKESESGLERIARIVAALKAFSNVDRASEEYTDLNECIRHAASVIQPQLPAGVALRLELLPLPPIVCLPGHLNQALFDLLRNAAQAIADSGQGGEIHIDSAADEQGIVIHIRDNGIGMQPEQLEHAFEPFYTTRPVGSGTGLGLSTARSIVLAHSGDITLDSRPGAGTTVTLRFPVPS